MADFVLQPGPVARREDYLLELCSPGVARPFVKNLHYTGGASVVGVEGGTHCLRRKLGGQLVGAALWLPPIQPAAVAAAREVLGDWRRWREVLMLHRLVVAPGEPFNTAGLLLAASLRTVAALTTPGPLRWRLVAGRLVQECAPARPTWTVAVTFADTAQKHTGIIYRATGWTLAGMTRGEDRWVDAAGNTVSRKSDRSRTVAEMKALGYRRDGWSKKLRFYKKLSGAPWPLPGVPPKMPRLAGLWGVR